MDECKERLDSCDRNSETCRNTAGAYECDIQCREGFRYDIRLRSCQGTKVIRLRQFLLQIES